MKKLLCLLCLAMCALMAVSAFADTDRVRALRLAGELSEARELAEQTLADPDTTTEQAFHLHLELARIHDRIGLHFRRRPVLAALTEIDKATGLAQNLDQRHRAQASLARATYFYRAEMANREFMEASRLVAMALDQFSQIGDRHGQAEAVHLRGLIHLQKRELGAARVDFDKSLELDAAGGQREFFVGEYERHVAFIHIFQNSPEIAIPHLQRSLLARKQAGAIDASLFASNTLAGQYLAVGDFESIPPLLTYSKSILQRLESPYGSFQTGLICGRFARQRGAEEDAVSCFSSARDAAQTMAWPAGVQQAEEYLMPPDSTE